MSALHADDLAFGNRPGGEEAAADYPARPDGGFWRPVGCECHETPRTCSGVALNLPIRARADRRRRCALFDPFDHDVIVSGNRFPGGSEVSRAGARDLESVVGPWQSLDGDVFVAPLL